MRRYSDVWSGQWQRSSDHVTRQLTIAVVTACLVACGSSGAEASPRVDTSVQQASTEQVALPTGLCDLLPQADAERIMGKSLVRKRNDDSGCHYQDAGGTEGTGLWVYHNVLQVKDQCGLTPRSQPLSGVGSEACIAVGVPAGLYTTVVFRGGGRTFEVTAPGQDRASELATAVAKVILSRLGS